jgi:hypothetical protein
MKIPADRVVAANWILHFSLLTFVVNLISVPYYACIIAHEHMGAYAYISILDALLKLSVAFMLTISPVDNLITYSLLLFVSVLLVRFIYGIYCNGKFYIGKTSDFGERLSTHIKDSRSDKKTSQQLYKDMVECGECLVFIFCIVEDKETFDRLEHEIIKECKEFSIGLSCNFDQQKIKFITESIDDTKEYSLNYCYNIID